MSNNYSSEQKATDFFSLQTHERFADIFLECCTQKIIILSEKDVYRFNLEYKYYERITPSILAQVISEVIHKWISKWEKQFNKQMKELQTNKDINQETKKSEITKLEKIQNNLKKAISNIETNYYKENVVKEVLRKHQLTPQQQSQLNILPNYINFRNYKLNLKTLECDERDENDFITEYLDYDFTPKCDKKIKNEILTILKQICNNNDDDLEFILSFIGYSLTSETKEQKYINIVGPSASNGKSTLIKLVESAFSIYTCKTSRELFTQGFSKCHKYFSDMKNKRICYVEELDKAKINIQLLKDVVDGNTIKNEVMFGTAENIDITFKLMFLSNNLMNFDNDEGFKRRTITTYFSSKFVDELDFNQEVKLNSDSNVFIKDKSLLKKFENDEYKNALVHILIKYSKKYFKDGLIVPSKFQKETDDLCDENDKMKTFIDNHFEMTKNDEDRIHKDEFKLMYDSYYKCNFGWNTILTDIKRCRLIYEKEKRTVYNGLSIRGVIVGIKKKKRVNENVSNHDDDDTDDDSVDENDARYTDKLKQVTKERDDYKIKCEQLTKQLEELKKQLSQNNLPKPEPQPEIKKDTQSKINLFDEILKIAVEVEPKKKSKYVIVDKFNAGKAKQGKPEQKEIIV